MMMREGRRLSLGKRGNTRVGSLFDQCCVCGSHVAQKLLSMHVNECLERSEERESVGERWKEGKKRDREEDGELEIEKGKRCKHGEGERIMEVREEIMVGISEEKERGRHLVEIERQFEDCKKREGECRRENPNEKGIRLSFEENLTKSNKVLVTQQFSNFFISGNFFSKSEILGTLDNKNLKLALEKSEGFGNFRENKAGMEREKFFFGTKQCCKSLIGDNVKCKLSSETCDCNTCCKFEVNRECTANCGFPETRAVGETIGREKIASETELCSISSFHGENCHLKDSELYSSLLVSCNNVDSLSKQDQVSTPISEISIKNSLSDFKHSKDLSIKDNLPDFHILNGESSTALAFQPSDYHVSPLDPFTKTLKSLQKEHEIHDSDMKEKAFNLHFIDPLDFPPKPINLLLSGPMTQSRISVRGGQLTKDLEEERKFSIRILQPGMVLFHNKISMDRQQKIVEEAQKVAGSFHRPSTGGGRKYHIYSTCWGSKWDGKSLRYISNPKGSPLPDWLFGLAQDLAKEANQYTPVLPPGTPFEPDIGLINYYPVKAEELGVIGLGGHQDLDDTCQMPVVSVSIGDSMTFFYRRLPPLSRRKSGVMVKVDRDSEKGCEEGDASYNREHTIILGSGDVLVFGGESRLVYHGTRNLQSGTKPPKLKMAPGRLNFTFRQHDISNRKDSLTVGSRRQV